MDALAEHGRDALSVMIASWWRYWVRRRLVPMMGVQLRRAATGSRAFRPTGPLAAWMTSAGL
eukprot:1084648-Pyramimonas_sp.AAC.1